MLSYESSHTHTFYFKLLYLVSLEEVNGSGNIKLSCHEELNRCHLTDKICILRLFPTSQLSQKLLHRLAHTQTQISSKKNMLMTVTHPIHSIYSLFYSCVGSCFPI